MFDILNKWDKLDWCKENIANFEYDKFWNHETNKFEYIISLTTDEKDEIFKFTVQFQFNKQLEEGNCYVYIDLFDARHKDEIQLGEEILHEIKLKCMDFNLWIYSQGYSKGISRCYRKKKNQD